MRTRLWMLVVALLGCTKADQETPARTQAKQEPGVAFAQPPPAPQPQPQPQPPPPAPEPPPPAPAKLTTKVELTAVTLADDCGGTPPWRAPAAPTKGATHIDKAKYDIDADADIGRKAKAKRRCEQTSMQLAVTASEASTMKIKSVELFDEGGKSLGKLKASKPTKWSTGTSMYEAWDQSLQAGTMVNVSYVLQQPSWDSIGDRWNRTFTLKTVVTIGGVDSAAKKSVTLSAPTTLPPNVKT